MYKWLYLLGLRLRNPSFNKCLRELEYTNSLSNKELEAYQLDKFKCFISFIYKHNKYYRSKFDDAGLAPESLFSVADLKKVPSLEKRDLRNHGKALQTEYKFNKTFIAKTSGTTGESISFLRNEKWDSINRAHVAMAYKMYGVELWDFNGYFWGMDFSSYQRLKVFLQDFLQNRRRLFSYNRGSVKKFIRRMKGARYLSGYSSMLFEAAKIVNAENMEIDNLKMIKGTAETILPAYQKEITKAFGRRMVSEYGSTEGGLIAFECPEGNMHVNTESVILNIIGSGEIIITNLESRSFPIINYKTGDFAESVIYEECPCGNNRPILKGLVGRQGKPVYGQKNTYPSLIFYYIFKNLDTKFQFALSYRVEQTRKGFVMIYIEGEKDERVEGKIRLEMKKYFGGDLDYSIQFLNEFYLGRKKRQYFASEL